MKTPSDNTVEILEARIAPAGLITVDYDADTGELALTGDTDSNLVRITQAGPGLHRIDGISTDVGAPGTTFFELGKLTKISFSGGDQADRLELANLTGLTSLDVSGDAGDDSSLLENVTVKGPVTLRGGAGSDSVMFDGILTSITGSLTVDSAEGSNDGVSLTFAAQTTMVSGPALFTGGGDSDSLQTTGSGAATFSKGIDFRSGTGDSSLGFFNRGALSVGKLATGESISFAGGDLSDALSFNGGNVTLASGIRMLGATGSDSISFEAPAAVVKVGKLSTGQSILFDGGADQESIALDGASTTLAGGIELLGGDGDNHVVVGATGSTVKVGKLATGQSILIAGGIDDDEIILSGANLSLAGGLEVAGGAAGGNQVNISSQGARASIGKMGSGASILLTGGADSDNVFLVGSSLTLAGGIDFAGAEGSNGVFISDTSNTIKLGKLTGGQSIRYTGGTGSDDIEVGGAAITLAGAIDVSAGDGANSLLLEGGQARTTVGKLAGGASVFFTGGTGSDKVTVGGNIVTLAGGVDLDLGDGTNDLDLKSENGVVKIGKLTGGQSLRFDGGTGRDSIDGLAASTLLAGGIEFAGESGNNRLNLDTRTTLVGRFGSGQSILFTGTGNADNEIDLGGVTSLAGSLEMTGGTGSEDIDLDGSVKIGKNAAGLSLSLVGNDGADSINFADDITLAGGIFFDGGAGGDDLNFNSVDTLSIGGTLEMIGGLGGDSFSIASYRLAVNGGVIFTAGDDTDSFVLQAVGSIAGDVTLNLGANTTGTESAILTSRTTATTGLIIKGALNIDADATNTTNDALTLTNVSVAKLVDIELGNGASTVTIDNLLAGDELRLNTRDGVDFINIERGNFFGESRITKLATIIAGAADDQIAIGGAPDAVVGFPDPTRVNFRGGLTVDGGDGLGDLRNPIETQNTFPAGLTPTITNVESAVLV